MTRRLLLVAAVAASGLVVAWLARQHGADRSEPSPSPVGQRVAGSVAALPTASPWNHTSVAVGLRDPSGASIVLIDAAGAAPPRRLAGAFEDMDAADWSRDGRRLAFAARRDANWDVYALGSDGTGLERLTDHPGFDGWPAWSPDGRSVAFVSYREGRQAVHVLDVQTRQVSAAVSAGEGPAIEPAWSPDGRWLAYAAWAEGSYRIEVVAMPPDADGDDGGTGARPGGDGASPVQGEGGTASRVVVDADGDVDMRAPSWSPDGARFAWLRARHGVGELAIARWSDAGVLVGGLPDIVAAQVGAFDWAPVSSGICVVAGDQRGREVAIVPPGAAGRDMLAELSRGPSFVAWGAAEASPALELVDVEGTATAVAMDRLARPGLARMQGIDVPGDRINAALAADFEALRLAVREGTGRDFLQSLSDGWRPLSFKSDASSFFSWHKVGRAFDTQTELRGPGYRQDMQLVREDSDGRTRWRMHLRAGAQDGTAGRPLTEPGWVFSAGGGASQREAEGGERTTTIPAGYWVDFTGLAEAYGWVRIPSLTGRDLNWRRDWEAIDYWHFERRDGLSWYEAARQVYTEEELRRDLDPERLRALDVSIRRLARAGFPSGWPEDS